MLGVSLFIPFFETHDTMTHPQARAHRLLNAHRNYIACGLWVWLACLGTAQAEPALLRAVSSVDLPRYMGTWHEIAKYPNWFQKKCASSTQATYSLLANGQVQVLNRCKTDKGEWSEALGAAKQIGGPSSAQLKVRFAPEWLSFIPMVWGDYWIIDLDQDYQWVMVSEPQRDYLWILSRTPQMPATTYQNLLGKLTKLGFDLKRLEPSPP
jgi:apolipoprotein D and lipocalin family protein